MISSSNILILVSSSSEATSAHSASEASHTAAKTSHTATSEASHTAPKTSHASSKSAGTASTEAAEAATHAAHTTSKSAHTSAKTTTTEAATALLLYDGRNQFRAEEQGKIGGVVAKLAGTPIELLILSPVYSCGRIGRGIGFRVGIRALSLLYNRVDAALHSIGERDGGVDATEKGIERDLEGNVA